MKLQHEMRLPELMGVITSMAPQAHIRVALTPDRTPSSSNSRWVVRSLVVDVYPANWLDRWNSKREELLSEPVPPVDTYDYPGQALFCLGYLPVDDIAKWFGYGEGQLYGFDERKGHDTRRQDFRLPELQDTAFGNRVFSRQKDTFATLPWPHFNYRYDLKGTAFTDNRDYQTLYSPKQRFDDFQEARGVLIHALTDLRNYQDRDQVMIRVVDGDGWIREAHLKDRKLKVTVAGHKLFGAQVILKGTGLQNEPDTKRDIRRPDTVDFTLTFAAPPDLRVILANGGSGDLDQAWLSPYPGLADLSSPHFIVEEDEPDKPIVAPASSAMKAAMSPAMAMRTDVTEESPPAEAQPSLKELVVPEIFFKRANRNYLVMVGRQINRTYENACYDACAVMVRRLIESLIIEVFEAKNLANEIKGPDDNFLYLSQLIDKINTHMEWGLSRNAKQALKRLKSIGDVSAHTRRYVAPRHDIEELIPDIRIVVQELLELAGLR